MLPIEPQTQPVLPDKEPFWDYFDLFLFVMLLVASLGISLFFAFLLVKFTSLPLAWKLLLPQLVLYALALTGLAAILRFRYDRPLWRSLGWKGTSYSSCFRRC